ncbi:MAG: precorrin-2 dehydrogenase/sirohydrochlorin ferrochelatase family protein [Gemmataceae bacterium]
MYPLFLDLTGRLAVVVGAGPVGRRKLAGLLAAGARVRVVCLGGEPAEGVEWLAEPYESRHLEGATLAFAAATSAVNARVVQDCWARGVLVCNAGDGAAGDFHTPAVHRDGPITVAVGTGGLSPGVAAELRDHLAGLIGPEWRARAAAGGEGR